MLPKLHRLTSDYDYRRLRRLGRSYLSSSFTFVVAQAKSPATLRFGFVVSNRLDKKAVVRNRLKRLLREAVYQLLPSLRAGFDASFFAKPSLRGKTYAQVLSEVTAVLSKSPLFLRPAA